MRIERLNGRVLSAIDLARLRREIESFGKYDQISDELRGIVARNWPHLLSRLPPEDEGPGDLGREVLFRIRPIL
jgi:hypothetical protein